MGTNHPPSVPWPHRSPAQAIQLPACHRLQPAPTQGTVRLDRCPAVCLYWEEFSRQLDRTGPVPAQRSCREEGRKAESPPLAVGSEVTGKPGQVNRRTACFGSARYSCARERCRLQRVPNQGGTAETASSLYERSFLLPTTTDSRRCPATKARLGTRPNTRKPCTGRGASTRAIPIIAPERAATRPAPVD